MDERENVRDGIGERNQESNDDDDDVDETIQQYLLPANNSVRRISVNGRAGYRTILFTTQFVIYLGHLSMVEHVLSTRWLRISKAL